MRLGRRRVLMADVRFSADGKGIAYGQLLIRIERVLRFGQVMGVAVFFVAPVTSINAAVFHLQSEDVEIVPPDSWRARWLKCVWFAAAPFRLGAPWLWLQRTVARGWDRVYGLVERTPRLPRAVRQFVLRPGPLARRLRAANAAYASRSSMLWKQTFKQHAGRRLKEAERAGIEMPLRLTLPPERERAAVELASQLGIRLAAPLVTPLATRLVTLHVRESGYRATAGLRQRSWDVIRNARIETYADACRALVERGYTVVRIGDRTMTPIRQAGVVDLATSPARTEWLELWCIQRSEFLIGCDSGPSWLASLLEVPILTVNAIHLRDLARVRDRVICKLARDTTSGALLSVSAMLTDGYLREGLTTGRYDHLDNSPPDIRQAVVDMIDVVHGREVLSPAQQRFNERLGELGRDGTAGPGALEGIAIRHRPRGTLARSFADRYFETPPGAGGA